jgi:hypothetical protein
MSGISYWKSLAKAEFGYLKPVLIAIFSLIIIPALIYAIIPILAMQPHGHGLRAGGSIIISVIISYLAVGFVMLFLDIRESRLRQLAALPVPLNAINFMQILIPLILFILFICLFLVSETMMTVGIEVRNNGMVPWLPSVISEALRQSLLDPVNFQIFSRCLTAVYLLWLFSEWQGRIIQCGLIILLVWSNSEFWFHRGPIYSTSYLIETLFNSISVKTGSPSFPWAISLVIMILLAIFFKMRRHYME